jgi:hypothetical protein
MPVGGIGGDGAGGAAVALTRLKNCGSRIRGATKRHYCVAGAAARGRLQLPQTHRALKDERTRRLTARGHFGAMVFCQGFSMRIELPGRRAPVAGSANEIGRAIAETLAANGPEGAVDDRKKADVEGVTGEIRGTVPRRPLASAPGDAADEVDILFDNVGR